MTEVLAVCQGERWPRGRGISVITGSGGLAELILDNATAINLDLPPLSADERKEVESVIGRITGDGNPFDAWGNGNYAVNLPHAMSVVDKSERISSICYCADTSNEGHLGHPGRVLENVKMLAEAAAKSSKPYYLLSSRSGVMNLAQAKAMREAGLVNIGGTRQGLAALDRVGRWTMGPQPVRKAGAHARSELPQRHTINEFDSKQLLAAQAKPHARSAFPSCSRSSPTRSRTRPSLAWSPSISRPRTTSPVPSPCSTSAWARSTRGRATPPSWCRSSSPEASSYSPACPAIPTSGFRSRSAWAAPRSR
jgi:acyl-CoA synthetase (NDP forming)